MDKLAEELTLGRALEVFENWRLRHSTIVVVIGSEGGWGTSADGVVEKLVTSPGQSGIEFWSLTEGRVRRIGFSGARFFRLTDLESAPDSLRSGWQGFLLVEFSDGTRLLFAERRSG